MLSAIRSSTKFYFVAEGTDKKMFAVRRIPERRDKSWTGLLSLGSIHACLMVGSHWRFIRQARAFQVGNKVYAERVILQDHPT
jgi:hypothetical protein